MHEVDKREEALPPQGSSFKDVSDKLIKKREEIDKKEAKKKSACEEVTETYVICNGSRYALDLKNHERLRRDTKKIDQYLDSEKEAPKSLIISK